MSYSISFRRHVLAVKERDGLTFAEAAERFSVGIASLVRWSVKLEPKAYRRKRGLKIYLEKLAQDVRDHPDAYPCALPGWRGCLPPAPPPVRIACRRPVVWGRSHPSRGAVIACGLPSMAQRRT
ncbi:MAG: IS630 transposase-related protein, partial [Pseudorhodobacter sp.]